MLIKLFHQKISLSMNYLTASQAMLATSEPAPGSVIARHIFFSPRRTEGTIFSFIQGLPNFIKGGKPITY